MVNDDFEEHLFNELANDEGIASAIAEHQAACSTSPTECPICRFFTMVHELRHMAEMFDPGKVVDAAWSATEFLDDAMAITQFFAEATRYFLTAVETMDEDEEDEG